MKNLLHIQKRVSLISVQYVFATGESIYLVDYSDGQLIKKIYSVIQLTPELNSVILVNCYLLCWT